MIPEHLEVLEASRARHECHAHECHAHECHAPERHDRWHGGRRAATLSNELIRCQPPIGTIIAQLPRAPSTGAASPQSITGYPKPSRLPRHIDAGAHGATITYDDPAITLHHPASPCDHPTFALRSRLQHEGVPQHEYGATIAQRSRRCRRSHSSRASARARMIIRVDADDGPAGRATSGWREPSPRHPMDARQTHN
jgi:hypothetical protein